MAFKKLGISEPILRSIQEARFEKPSEIQEKTIPLVLAGKDVIAGSATGSGKTLAFGAGIIDRCERGKGVQSLVLTPTRELAEQVAKSLKLFSKYKPLHIIPIYGGVSIQPQIHDLQSAEVVVGTPGRILDHLQRQTLNLSRVKILVLDEADRMLEMGFIEDVERIIQNCPSERQTLLFSATIYSDLAELSKKYMHQAVKILAEPQVDPTKLRQVYYDSADNIKFSLLVHLLKHEQSGLIMVFCNTQKNTDFVANNLRHLGVEAQAIHGGFSQAKRNKVMQDFHSAKVYVLVCTDVAGRGLDIPGVSHVYNYDIPKDSKQYIHRIGRTARAGKEGIAVNLLTSRDYENFDRVLREQQMKIPKMETPKVERVEIGWKEQPRQGRGFGSSRGGSGYRSGDRRGSSSGYRSGSSGVRSGERTGSSSGYRSGDRRGSSSGYRSGSSSHSSSGARTGSSFGGRSNSQRSRR